MARPLVSIAVLLAALLACEDRTKPPPPRSSPPAAGDADGPAEVPTGDAVEVDATDVGVDAGAGADAGVDAGVAIDLAKAKLPAGRPGSLDAHVAAWWNEVVEGRPQAHAGGAFVVEAFVPPGVLAGQPCGNPYVVDRPTDDVCLRLVVASSRPARWRDGWGCPGFSGTDLARMVRRDREAAKDRLRCGTGHDVAVFVAVDAAGKVSAFLVTKRDSR